MGYEPSPSGAWNPQQYWRFRDERSRPFHDLLALLRPFPTAAGPVPPQAVDLGCGTGELTRTLYEHLCAGGGSSRLLGLDNSAAMLANAHGLAGNGLVFAQAGIETFARGWLPDTAAHGGEAWRKDWDLIFSNAALQWVPEHAALFAALCRRIAPGGQLAVQMPCNDDHPAYQLAAEIARLPEFSAVLDGYVRESPVMPPEWYAALLHAHGLSEITVRVEVYAHLLAEPLEAAQWVKGSLLTAYTSRLEEPAAQAYFEVYCRRLQQLLPDERPYLFTFKRIFLSGVRP